VRHPVHRAGSELPAGDFVRRFGSKVYYGDASRLELLEAAKTGEARLFVLAIDDRSRPRVKTAEVVRKPIPTCRYSPRAQPGAPLPLRDLGVEFIWRETFPASLEMARQALLSLGFDAAASDRAMTLFRRHDERQIDAQYAVQHDEAQLIQSAKEAPSSCGASSKRTASSLRPDSRSPRRRGGNADGKMSA